MKMHGILDPEFDAIDLNFIKRPGVNLRRFDRFGDYLAGEMKVVANQPEEKVEKSTRKSRRIADSKVFKDWVKKRISQDEITKRYGTEFAPLEEQRKAADEEQMLCDNCQKKAEEQMFCDKCKAYDTPLKTNVNDRERHICRHCGWWRDIPTVTEETGDWLYDHAKSEIPVE